jgi:predicted nucleic acid-binding protein
MQEMTNGVTVDASVWISAIDPTDPFHLQSRAFLHDAVQEGVQLLIPTFAVTEVSCALARRRRSADAARQLIGSVLAPDRVRHVPLDSQLLAASLSIGMRAFLRGADALYAATAYLTGSTLVSWDNELVQRVGATTPTSWLTGGR